MKPPHTPAFRKSTSLGGPLQGQRRDGADEKGADQVDGKRPDGKAPVPSQWNLPSQITVHGPQESPKPHGNTVQHGRHAPFHVICGNTTGRTYGNTTGGRRQEPAPLRQTGRIRPRAQGPTGKPAAGCCASGEIHI